MRAIALTDVGITRENNEDYYLIHENLEIFIIADGMGGYQAGEVASELAATTIMNGYNDIKTSDLENQIPNLLNKANEAILENVKIHPECRGMGTTIVIACIYGDDLWVFNVGDSRCYGVRNGSLIQLSEDHSLVAELVKIGSISAEEAAIHPDRNIITSALGVDRKFEIFTKKFNVQEFSHIILCSDGLSNMVTSHELLEIINSRPFDEIPKAMVDSANSSGGKDNITVICVEL
ncbi:Stp1/IreP family PP2C-type Ser/Thr phosphatase [Fusibacter bizertensis]